MLIKLLEDIIEYDRHGEPVGMKRTRTRNPAWGPPVVVHDQLVVSQESEFIETSWKRGAVVDLSESSAQKYVEAGKGELVS